MKCANCHIVEVYMDYKYCRACTVMAKDEYDALDDIRSMVVEHEREVITSSSSDPEDY